MTVIVNYNMGNSGSIKNMLRRIGFDSSISSDPDVIAEADRLILPGVGAFDAGMRSLDELGLIDVLHTKVLKEGTPILGICLGMQLMSSSSEEGDRPGLGWISASTIRFRLDSADLKVPHMGWNSVVPSHRDSIFANLDENARYYFVHTYHVVCNDAKDVLGSTRHGIEFTSSVQCDNVIGTQFHPEKSHRFGMQLLENFVQCT